MTTFNINNLELFNTSVSLANEIWVIVREWDYFPKDTIWRQLVRAADSVPANISEGYGRYYFKEEKQFLYYARGSLFEINTFLTMAHQRNLIPLEKYNYLKAKTEILGKMLNSFINSINRKQTIQGNTNHLNQ